MNIAFDSAPLISDRMTGIGYCQSGQVKAVTDQHPNDTFKLQYFSVRSSKTKEHRLIPYKKENTTTQPAYFSSLLYRAISNFIPIPYSLFFGKSADVTHFFNYIVPPFVNTATVVTVHDMVYRSYPETMNKRTYHLLNMSLKRSMKRATLIVTDSEFSKSEIIKYFPQFKDKIRVVYCGVDFDKFSDRINEADIARVKINFSIHGDYFLYLGTLEPRKNLVRLIEAYAKLKEQLENKGKKVPFLVMAGGKGWLSDDIFETVRNFDLKDNIIFTKYIPDEDLSPLIRGALAFVFPSIYEGFGLPPLEAMACKVPVIVSDAASLPEVVGDCAIIVDPFDTDSIKNGMLTVYEDTEFSAEIAEKGMQRARKFTWEQSAKDLWEVYKEADELYKAEKK
jgi:glycosyltransferase involved in cell wall biosynthesis